MIGHPGDRSVISWKFLSVADYRVSRLGSTKRSDGDSSLHDVMRRDVTVSKVELAHLACRHLRLRSDEKIGIFATSSWLLPLNIHREQKE